MVRKTNMTEPTRGRRATRSVGLVLVGTAALLLGVPAGCKEDRQGTQAQQGQPTTRSSGGHYYGGGVRGAGRGADGTQGANSTSRGGFGSSGRAAAAGS